MPLADGGMISKGYWAAPPGVTAARKTSDKPGSPPNPAKAEAAPKPAIISRRLSNPSWKSLRRLKVVVAKLLRAPFVRRAVRGQLAVNRKFLLGIIALAGTAVSHR